ncbi:MAG: xanthine dehydrogenase family protein molybdopterin-binding subunit [Hyphomicrobiaceae bacterium]
MGDRGGKVIGQSVNRLEDPPLLAGRGAYVDDISFPGQLHMRMVRSPEAHGRILSVDASAALEMPGVHAVWTSSDISDLPPIEFREGPIEALAPWRQPVLANGTVRYVGEPIAAVFAESPYIAEDAAGLVFIEIEPLAPIMHAYEPTGEFAPGRSTEPTVCLQGYGDSEAALKGSAVTVELDLSVGRHSGVPIETRGAIGRYDAARDVLELHGAAKVPHKNRETFAEMFGLGLAQMHVFEGHTGGGFGIRGEIYPEDILVLVAARRFMRPVKWIEDRREHLVTANHSRQQRHHVKAGIDSEGRLIVLDDEFFHDQGAYIRTHATRVCDMTCGILPGPYRLPTYRAAGHFRLTNKTPAATYRAPGRFETNFVRERLMDAIAARLGISRVEVRRRNLIAKEEMPYERPLAVLGDEVSYDSGDYALLLDKALEQFGWDEAEARAAERRKAGELVGLGLTMFVEKSGLGPTDGAHVSVDPYGKIEVITGGASIGQGFETAMAQVCAETLGVDYRNIRVVHGRTDRIPFGIGAHASRATVMTGNATAAAAANVRAKALEVASELMQVRAEELDIVGGTVVVKGRASGPSITLGEIAKRLRPTSPHRGGRAPGLSADGWFDTKHQTYPYGVQIAQIRIDRETCGIELERILAAYDIGRAINPKMVAGQIQGGFAQGLGGAVFEEFLYDGRGQPLAMSLADYLMPTAMETPTVEILLSEDAPSTQNPLGIKGAGESGISPVGSLIASAVDDALSMPGAVRELPITPMRLKKLIDASCR